MGKMEVRTRPPSICMADIHRCGSKSCKGHLAFQQYLPTSFGSHYSREYPSSVYLFWKSFGDFSCLGNEYLMTITTLLSVRGRRLRLFHKTN